MSVRHMCIEIFDFVMHTFVLKEDSKIKIPQYLQFVIIPKYDISLNREEIIAHFTICYTTLLIFQLLFDIFSIEVSNKGFYLAFGEKSRGKTEEKMAGIFS